MDRVILHVDMDAFYASVEQRDDPGLRGLPVVVGGDSIRGVVLAASYEVRPLGVRSAMSMRRAMALAPHARVVPPRFEAYAQASEQVFAILESYTPVLEPLSLDEAFMDVTGSIGLLGSPRHMAQQIRHRIAHEVGLPASAGIAAVKFVAKMASDGAKPNGVLEVAAADTLAFLHPQPVNRLWGVGPKTEQRLHQMGLRTIGALAAADPDVLEAQLGSQGAHLHALALGRDDRPVIADRQAKSIGAEDTFEEDLQGPERLLPHIHAQAERVARRLRRAGMATRVVQLKLKTDKFQLSTRRTTLVEPTQDGAALFHAARDLLLAQVPQTALRLTGVSAQELVEGGQLPLLDAGARRAGRLNQAADLIAQRFGRGALTTADVAGVQGAGPPDPRSIIEDRSALVSPLPPPSRSSD